ncbi:hypothetical protein [Methylobacterium sp. Leaf466]|uniref:hypothetical protein n=1 Tax=Methylobacterium sp. Leaf466 TaxID=1736386 RepID=UPI0009E6BCBD|nr:hypothetical protein [Methylobacterium sp. Leaf466]
MRWSQRMSLRALGSVLVLASATAGVSAQGYYGGSRSVVYGPSYGHGFAEPAIRGDYIGAPFTRFPSPSDIVPPAWGYGTYGIPTASGIRAAPSGVPTVYVIDAPARRSGLAGDDRTSRPGVAYDARRGYGGGARVISVSVPRR